MLVLKGKKKLFFYFILFLFFTTYQINQNNIFPLFKIKKVIFLGSKNFEQNIKNNITESLLGQDLFNIQQQKIALLIADSQWVKSYIIKKKYPDEISFNLIEYKPLAIQQKKNKLYLINDNFLITDEILDKSQNLNLINIKGEYEIKNFKNLYTQLSKFNFFKDLVSIIFLELDRVELIFKGDISMKLGKYSYEDQLNIINKIIETKSNFSSIDLRNEGIVIFK